MWQRVKRNAELSELIESHTENINGTVFVDEVIEKHIKELYSQRFTVNTGVNTVNIVDDDTVNTSDNAVNMLANSVNIVDNTVNMSANPVNIGDGDAVNTVNVVNDDPVNMVDNTVNMFANPVNMSDDTVNIGVNTVNIVNDDPVNMVDNTVNMSSSTVNVDGDTVNMLIKALQSDIETMKQQLIVKDNQINELTELLRESQEQQATLATALANAQALHAGTIRERLENNSHETEPKRQKSFFSKIFGKK